MQCQITGIERPSLADPQAYVFSLPPALGHSFKNEQTFESMANYS